MPTPRYWIGPVPPKDYFGIPITDEFVDGATVFGPWARMAPRSYNLHGRRPLGQGRGQRYQKQDDGRWLKTEG